MHAVKWVTFNRLDQWEAQVELYEDIDLAWLRVYDINDMFHNQADLDMISEVPDFIDGEAELVRDIQFSDNNLRERMKIDE